MSNLDLAYYNNNQTLEFDISAASVRPDLNVTVSLQVNAYGISAVNLNLDLCSVVNGVLCPLPQYNFNGACSYLLCAIEMFLLSNPPVASRRRYLPRAR